MEFLKDYEFDLNYQPGKANAVAKDEIGYNRICKQMFGLPEDKDRTSEIIGHAAAFGDPRMEMESISMDFIMGLPRTPIGCDSI